MAGKWVDAQFACTDFVEESARVQAKVTKGRIDTEVYAACLGDALTDEQIHDGTVDALTGDWQGRGSPRSAAPTDCAAEATPADAELDPA